MIKFLTVAAGVVTLAAIAIVVHFSSQDWKTDYAPNLAVAIAELTVGAALVAGYLTIRRRIRQSHLQGLVDGQIFQAVARMLSVIQASYIEAADKPVPSVPLTVSEVLDRWRIEVKTLDLRRPTTYDSSVRWATYLPTEVLGALTDLASLVARFPDLTEEVIGPLVELEVHDDFVTLLRYLPDHGPTHAPRQPATLVPSWGAQTRSSAGSARFAARSYSCTPRVEQHVLVTCVCDCLLDCPSQVPFGVPDVRNVVVEVPVCVGDFASVGDHGYGGVRTIGTTIRDRSIRMAHSAVRDDRPIRVRHEPLFPDRAVR